MFSVVQSWWTASPYQKRYVVDSPEGINLYNDLKAAREAFHIHKRNYPALYTSLCEINVNPHVPYRAEEIKVLMRYMRKEKSEQIHLPEAYKTHLPARIVFKKTMIPVSYLDPEYSHEAYAQKVKRALSHSLQSKDACMVVMPVYSDQHRWKSVMVYCEQNTKNTLMLQVLLLDSFEEASSKAFETPAEKATRKKMLDALRARYNLQEAKKFSDILVKGMSEGINGKEVSLKSVVARQFIKKSNVDCGFSSLKSISIVLNSREAVDCFNPKVSPNRFAVKTIPPEKIINVRAVYGSVLKAAHGRVVVGRTEQGAIHYDFSSFKGAVKIPLEENSLKKLSAKTSQSQLKIQEKARIFFALNRRRER